MKKVVFLVCTLFLLANASTLLAQKNVFISKDVIKTADQIKVDYKDLVKKASNQDSKAIVKLFEFSRILDAPQTSEHALTCLEIIPLAGDQVTALAIKDLNPKLKNVLLEWLVKAQSQTSQETLKKPIKSWAPYTWEALNNRPVIIARSNPGGQQNVDAVDQGSGGSLKEAQKTTSQPAPDASNGSLKPANTGRGQERGGGN